MDRPSSLLFGRKFTNECINFFLAAPPCLLAADRADRMISITSLQFSYPGDQFDLQIPNLNIPAGASAAITGPSGSGKTTLLNLIAGILLPNTGEVCVAETVVNRLPDSGRREFRLTRIGMIFQDFQLIEYLSVLDNVLLPCRLNRALKLSDELRQRALTLLDRVGLAGLRQKSVTQLSQGERQRVAICRALLLKPRLILADEPTGNLDPENSDRILQLLLSQAREHQATAVVVTHDHSLLPHFDHAVPFEDFLRPTRSSATPQAEPSP